MKRISVILLVLFHSGFFLFGQPGNFNTVDSALFKKMTPAAVLFLSGSGNYHKESRFIIQLDSLKNGVILHALEQLPGNYFSSSKSFVSVKTRFEQIAKIPGIASCIIAIDIAPGMPVEELATPGFDLSANKLNVLQQLFPLVNGTGMVASVKENLFDTTDIDIKGRIIPSGIAAATVTNHAGFMATLIAGAGNSIYYGKGAAWAASVSSSSFQSLLPDANTYYSSNNISVQNNSYGTVIDNNYAVSTVAFDVCSNQNSGLLQVFSAGNTGQAASSAGVYAGITGWANLSGNIKQTKNSLVVGEADSFGIVSAASARGPAYDGRIKPDLVAFGKDGTSESAAIVSGTALLLQQLYKAQHAGAQPLSSTIKAAMINGADDIGAAGPDYTTGFGNLNAINAAKIISEDKLINGNITPGGIQQYSIIVPPNTSRLKITLAWNDNAATAGAAGALVNDIDLELLLPAASQSWKPWVLNAFPNADSLIKLPVRKKDSINNVEQVTVENPAAGNYIIKLTGYKIVSTNQAWSIAYNWDNLNYFEWQHPMTDDVMEAGKQNILRWANGYSGTGQAEYSINGGVSWTGISASADLSKNYLRWNAPDTLTRCLLRMKIAATYFYSDTFLLSKLVIPKVGFDCRDSLLLYWNKINPAVKYKIYQLGAKYMEPFSEVTDTTILIAKSAISNRYFSVAPILANGTIMAKGSAVNYSQQGTGCFVQSFLADKTGLNTATLTLQLGTAYKVAGIVFEQYQSNGPQTVFSTAANGALLYSSVVSPLKKGISLFRAKIILADGAIVYSDWVELINADEPGYLIFPNPVHRNETLQLITAAPNGESFVLYNATGNKIIEKTIAQVKENISSRQLQAGIYFYKIVKDGRNIRSGKIIVL